MNPVVSFCINFEGNFPSTNLRGAHIWRGDLTEGFLRYRFGGVYLEGPIFGILRYANESHNCTNLVFVMSSPLFSQKKLQMVDFFFRLFFRNCVSRVFHCKDPLCSYFSSSLFV